MWHRLFPSCVDRRSRSGTASPRAVMLSLDELESRLVPSSLPTPDHVVIVIEENQTFSGIIGSPAAPYINSLAQQAAVMTDSNGLILDSLTNYLYLFSGDNQGVSRGNYPSTAP